MTSDDSRPTSAPARSRWLTPDVPGALLLVGYLVVVVAALALATVESWVGIAAVAVLLSAVIVLLASWCGNPGPLSRD